LSYLNITTEPVFPILQIVTFLIDLPQNTAILISVVGSAVGSENIQTETRWELLGVGKSGEVRVMPAFERIKTKYPGVYYVMGTATTDGKPERIFYIVYRKDGRLIEEKAGRQHEEDMTAARAAGRRADRIKGHELSNKERREAERAVKQAERAKEEAEANRWTIDRLWNEYKAQHHDLKGLRTDQNRFENYIKPQFGEKEPKALIPLDVDRVRIGLLKKPKRTPPKTKKPATVLKPATVRNVLELLRRVINFGVKKKLCGGVPFTIELPKVNNLKTEDLSAAQLTRLLEAIEKDENIQAKNLMKMALFTGMRRGELFKLKWNDIDFEREFIHLRDPKGGVDQKVPLSSAAKDVLKSHPRTAGIQLVFPGRAGKQRVDIHHQVNSIKEKAGLPKGFRALHGLRHAYASMLASSGQVDMYTLQKLLTHKSPLMTQRYAHLRDETLKKASNIAGSIINEAVASMAKAASSEERFKMQLLPSTEVHRTGSS
jgi:integrase